MRIINCTLILCLFIFAGCKNKIATEGLVRDNAEKINPYDQFGPITTTGTAIAGDNIIAINDGRPIWDLSVNPVFRPTKPNKK